MSANENEPTSNLGITLIASAAGILLFALIIWITYLPTRSANADAATKASREQKLVETKAKAAETLNNYAVVSKTEGIYRMPIDKAMELTVKSYQN